MLLVITRCLMSAPDVGYPLNLTRLFHLNKNWVAALSLSKAAERLEVSSLKSSEKPESFTAGWNINRPERAQSSEWMEASFRCRGSQQPSKHVEPKRKIILFFFFFFLPVSFNDLQKKKNGLIRRRCWQNQELQTVHRLNLDLELHRSAV